MNELRYRLGLDLGTNSLGWAVIALDDANRPCRVVRIGARIFPSGLSPKDSSSLAVDRRMARQTRRRRDRYLRRRDRFIQELVLSGLFPAGEAERQALVSLNPYRLRAEGLDRELLPYELGRALFHLQQRRGFKSNRKTDKSTGDPEKETSKLKKAISDFSGEITGTTVGAELWRRIQNGQPARARLIGSGQKATYTFYVGRDMVAQEFDALWEAQQEFHPELLTEVAKQRIRDVLLYQRELLPQHVGGCFFERNELRAPIALPSAQLFRLYQEVNHLRLLHVPTLTQRALTREERDKVVESLLDAHASKFTAIRRTLFGAVEARQWKFTIEDDGRTELKGDQVSAKLSSEKAFGPIWSEFSPLEKENIVKQLIDMENGRELVEWLTAEFSLSLQNAQYIADVPLPNGHLRLSAKAIARILPQLIEGWDDDLGQALTYDQAVLAAGYGSHSQTHDGTLHDLLPYYGEVLYRYTMPAEKASGDEKVFGKIGNPTVHIGLNQVRKVVNALITKYGLPTQVVIEVARELKQSQEAKAELKKIQKKSQDENTAIRRQLVDLGQTDNFDNRLRLRLYNELQNFPKRCIYSGRAISLTDLFTNEYQVDHILPLSRTLDDSYPNKVLVHQSANKYKGNRSPYEAFGASSDGYSWDEILERVQSLPRNKQRRFSPEAMLEAGSQKDFLARQLNDTAYLARVSKQYLDAVCPDVWVTPGRLTALLRGKWNLNSILSDSGKKERTDHRHHAIDAAVIAVTDRGLLNHVSHVAALAEHKDLDRRFDGFPDPWDTFREELVAAAQKVVISYKPDHGTGSSLHNDTAYGIVSDPDASGKFRVRHRIPIESIRQKHLKSLQCDGAFLESLELAIFSASNDNEITKNLTELKALTGRRTVPFVETLSVVPIYAKGRPVPYKAYKGDSNYCYEIVRTAEGKWDGQIVSSFEAQSQDYQKFKASSLFRDRAWSGEELVMRIMSDDLIAIEENDVRRIMRVQKITPGTISMAEHLEGNVDARERDKESGFSYTRKAPNSLRGVRARRVFVDPIGNVFDPGFKE